MNRIRTFAVWSAVIASAVAIPTAVLPQRDTTEEAGAAHRATLDQYCVVCHNGAALTAGLNLEAADIIHPGNEAQLWEKVRRKLRNHEMPPAGMPRPEPKAYEGLITYIERQLDRQAAAHPNPGRPALRRLNRAEYANAVRDLLALEIDATALLPADDIGYGFDNIGDSLNVSPLLLDRYLSAAAKISRMAIGDPAMPAIFQTYDLPRGLKQIDWMGKDMPFGSRGGSSVRHYFPVDGEYEISVELQTGRGDQIMGLERDRKLDLRLDGASLGQFTIERDARAGARFFEGEVKRHDAHLHTRLPVKAGTHAITASFFKDTVLQEGVLEGVQNASGADLTQAFFEGVGKIVIAGPYNTSGQGKTASRDRIFVCRPSAPSEEEACAKAIISKLTHRAYRRPISESDLPPLLALYRQGAKDGGFEAGIRLTLQKILVSPEFIFRFENDPANAKPGSVYSVSDLELASRLSFFLWSTIPDDELLSVAERGELSKPRVLEAQVRRMLADKRSLSLVSNFAGQWLFLRNIDKVQPDPAAFPNFDENLRRSMQKETELLLEFSLREDRSVAELLDTDYTFMNQRLAEHYGIKGIYGSEFKKVAITDENRRGLMGQASILTVTSYPNRTAPTIRGKWVLQQLLSAGPPPPPPNVPSLKENNQTRVMTMRERMEEHRRNPACAVCHKMMDPLGFALDNFDGVGHWRNTASISSKVPIDSSGILPDGTKFNGPKGLREVLLTKKDLFIETFTERLLTYALGRGVESYDYPAIREIKHGASDSNYKWSAIILGIVKSAPFQKKRVKDI